MDTIYKEYGDTFGMFGISSGNFVSASNVLSHIGVGNTRRPVPRAPRQLRAAPDRRDSAASRRAYQYSPDEKRGDPGYPEDADLWSVGVKFDSPVFYVSLHRELHNDLFGGSIKWASALKN